MGSKKFATFRQVLPSSCHTPPPSLPSPTCPLHLLTSPAGARKPPEFAAPGWVLPKDPASCHITKCFHSPCLSPVPHPTPSHLSSTENHSPSSQHACFTLAFPKAAPPVTSGLSSESLLRVPQPHGDFPDPLHMVRALPCPTLGTFVLVSLLRRPWSNAWPTLSAVGVKVLYPMMLLRNHQLREAQGVLQGHTAHKRSRAGTRTQVFFLQMSTVLSLHQLS